MDRFDRQRKIFGDEGQKQLGAASVGVVGGGGLGSFVVLELAYLGVGKILIVDDDCLDDEHSNRNRLVGAWESHEPGVPKVQILRDLALMIDLGIKVEVVEAPLESAEAKAALAGVDGKRGISWGESGGQGDGRPFGSGATAPGWMCVRVMGGTRPLALTR